MVEVPIEIRHKSCGGTIVACVHMEMKAISPRLIGPAPIMRETGNINVDKFYCLNCGSLVVGEYVYKKLSRDALMEKFRSALKASKPRKRQAKDQEMALAVESFESTFPNGIGPK